MPAVAVLLTTAEMVRDVREYHSFAHVAGLLTAQHYSRFLVVPLSTISKKLTIRSETQMVGAIRVKPRH